jgi:hypothetical protein
MDGCTDSQGAQLAHAVGWREPRRTRNRHRQATAETQLTAATRIAREWHDTDQAFSHDPCHWDELPAEDRTHMVNVFADLLDRGVIRL